LTTFSASFSNSADFYSKGFIAIQFEPQYEKFLPKPLFEEGTEAAYIGIFDKNQDLVW